MTATAQLTVITCILQDHRVLADRLEELCSAPPEQRGRLLGELARNLEAHEATEQFVVYPIVVQRASAGALHAGHRRDEEHNVGAILSKLQRLFGEPRPFQELTAQLAGALYHHFDLEERTVLPLLRETCDEGELVALASQFELSRGAPPPVHGFGLEESFA